MADPLRFVTLGHTLHHPWSHGQVRYVIENVESVYGGKKRTRLLKARDMLVERQKVRARGGLKGGLEGV
eukprot:3471251-Pyramimonas_sp.AAC.1